MGMLFHNVCISMGIKFPKLVKTGIWLSMSRLWSTEMIDENENDLKRTRTNDLMRLHSGSALEYQSRCRGFESYSGHFHSHKLPRLVFKILLLPEFWSTGFTFSSIRYKYGYALMWVALREARSQPKLGQIPPPVDHHVQLSSSSKCATTMTTMRVSPVVVQLFIT